MEQSNNKSLDGVLAKRYSFLHLLIKNSRRKCDLEKVTDTSRSTLNRSLNDLKDVELVEYESGEWKPTALGECCYYTRKSYLSRLEDLSEAAPLLNELSTGTLRNCRFIYGSDVHEPDPSIPDAVLQILLDSVEDGQDVFVVTPVIITGFAEQFYERVSSSKDYSLELLIQSDVFERSRATFPELTSKLFEDENVNLYTVSISLNFGLWIVDSTEAGIIVFNNQGVRGILMNDTSAALDWAKEQYRRAKQDADPVFLRGRV